MTRFGEFTLLDELGESEVADCFKAAHDVQGGPFFLKRYRRLDPTFSQSLLSRCDMLMTVSHPNLAPHLGHGDVDGVVFAVSPWLEGISLEQFIESLTERRVVAKLESLLFLVREVALGVNALLAAATDGRRPLLAHGEVCARHVRIGPGGEVWLTGLPTPRGTAPESPPESVWDVAGLGAMVYDLMPLTRGGRQRPSLPPALERVVRRSLGIGSADDQLSPGELANRLDEVAEELRLPQLDRRTLHELAARTIQAVQRAQAGTAADALPTLEPVFADELEPVDTMETPLEPVAGRVRSHEDEAATLPIARPPPASAPPAAAAPSPKAEPAPMQQPDAAQVPAGPRPVTIANFQRPPELADLQAPADPTDDDEDSAFANAFDSAFSEEGPAATLEVPVMADDGGQVDPFAEQTLPGHLVDGLPSDEAIQAEEEEQDGFESEHTRPEHAAFDDDGATDPGRRSLVDITEDAPPPSGEGAAGLAKVDPVVSPPPPRKGAPREVSMVVRLDEAIKRSPAPRSPFGSLLADPVEEPPPEESTTPALSAPPPKPRSNIEPAAQALLARGVVSAEELLSAREERKERGGRVTEILVAKGMASDDAVADALAAESKRPRLGAAELKKRLPAPELCRRLPQTYALARRMLPLALADKTLTLAVADPFDQDGLAEVKKLLRVEELEVVVAARGELTAATRAAYRATGISDVPGTQGEAPFVLLCLDRADEVERIGARLAEEGFHVEDAADVPTARMLLDARPPDAILASHDMADMVELIVTLRAHDDHADTPLFVVGDGGDEQAMENVLDLGADDYFERPLKFPLLLAKARRALAKVGKAAAPPPPKPRPKAPPPPQIDASAGTDPSRRPLASAPPPPPQEWTNTPTKEKRKVRDVSDLPDLPTETSAPPAGRGAQGFAEPTGVMGTLRQMAVPEIVQSLEMGKKTARVELVPTGGPRGSIGFEAGQVVWAECEGDRTGAEAFYELARYTEGFFRIRYGEAPPGQNIEGSTTFLLLEAMRIMDEGEAGSALDQHTPEG